ncbi:MAG: hypothetical protein JST62_03470 [Bacteroidetes bacterium]|nr:hypothetical protein [Bacteroidota bacterium]
MTKQEIINKIKLMPHRKEYEALFTTNIFGEVVQRRNRDVELGENGNFTIVEYHQLNDENDFLDSILPANDNFSKILAKSNTPQNTKGKLGNSIFKFEQKAGIDSKMGNWAGRKYFGEDSGNKTLSIKYLSCSAYDTNYNLTFEVSQTNLKKFDATIYVEEMNATNESAVPKTKAKLSLKQKTNITVSFSKNKEFDHYYWQSGLSYRATITCDGISAETEEFTMKCASAKKGCNLNEPKAVISKKLTFTEEQKAKFVATIYGEASTAENQFEPFCWVYFNLVSRQGFEKGMSNSYAYKDENYLYKDAIKNYTTGKIPSVNKIKKILESKLLVNKPLNPYPGWEGQGYYGDMNIRAPKTSYRRVWAYASQYFHLQNQCKVKAVLVKEYKFRKPNSDGKIVDKTGYIYNFNEIEKYFKNHPKDLPDFELGQCKYDKLSPTQKNKIPAVYIIEECQTNK